MLAIKRSVAIIAILFSPLSAASNLYSYSAQSTTVVRAAIAFDEQ